jgi:hypothetical protein
MAAWMHWLRPQVESENLFIHGLVFFIKFLQSKKKREKKPEFMSRAGALDQIPRNILWHYGEKNYAPVLYLTHSGRTKGLILSCAWPLPYYCSY